MIRFVVLFTGCFFIWGCARDAHPTHFAFHAAAQHLPRKQNPTGLLNSGRAEKFVDARPHTQIRRLPPTDQEARPPFAPRNHRVGFQIDP
jgi:hypothetical protein